jgi:hypothetical protein
MRLFLSSLNSGLGGVTPPPVMGCTNPLATNYDPLATMDDGSCVFPSWELPVDSVRLTSLTGQSNASGEGLNSEALSSEIDVTTDLKIWRRFTWNWADLNISSGNNYPNQSGKHGLELPLSLYQEANFDYPLYLAKYGSGGSSVLRMMPGGDVFEIFYYDFLARAVNNLLASGQRVFFDFVYHQGEQETNATQAPLFSDRLQVIIDFYQSIFGPNLTMSFVEINYPGGEPYTSQVNAVFASKVTDHIKVIEASSAPVPDGIHFSYAAIKTIGENYATRMAGVEPFEVLTPLPVPADTTPPATPTLLTATNAGSTFTITFDLNGGDAVSDDEDLTFTIWNGFNPLYRSGSVNSDSNVSIAAGIITIINIPKYGTTTPSLQVSCVDEAWRNSAKSNSVTVS